MSSLLYAQFPMCTGMNLKWFCMHKILCTKTYDLWKPEAYAEASQRFNMECFAKIVKNYNYISKAVCLRSLKGFWIYHLSVSTLSNCRVSFPYVLYEIYSEPWHHRALSVIIYLDKFRHIHILFRCI